MSTWITSNATDDGVWHLAREVTLKSPSGRDFGTSRKTACSGKQLGGAYGYTKAAAPGDRVCERCARLAGKSV